MTIPNLVHQAAALLEPSDELNGAPLCVDLSAMTSAVGIAQAQQEAWEEHGTLPPDLIDQASACLAHWYQKDLQDGLFPFCVDPAAARLVADRLDPGGALSQVKSSVTSLSQRSSLVPKPSQIPSSFSFDCWNVRALLRRDVGVEPTPQQQLQRALAPSTEFRSTLPLTPSALREYAPLFLWYANRLYFTSLHGRQKPYSEYGTEELPLRWILDDDAGNGLGARVLEQACVHSPAATAGVNASADLHLDVESLVKLASGAFRATREETLMYLLEAYLDLRDSLPQRKILFHSEQLQDGAEEAVRRRFRTDTAHATTGFTSTARAISEAYYASPGAAVPAELSITALAFEPRLYPATVSSDAAGQVLVRHEVDSLELTGLMEVFLADLRYQGYLAQALASAVEDAQTGAELDVRLLDLGFTSMSSAQLLRLLQDQPVPDFHVPSWDQVRAKFLALSEDPEGAAPQRLRAFERNLRLRNPQLDATGLQNFMQRLQAHAGEQRNRLDAIVRAETRTATPAKGPRR